MLVLFRISRIITDWKVLRTCLCNVEMTEYASNGLLVESNCDALLWIRVIWRADFFQRGVGSKAFG